ncbi:MAG: hypothetical protein AAGD96_20525, partial [Chloroflexota bacterium]
DFVFIFGRLFRQDGLIAIFAQMIRYQDRLLVSGLVRCPTAESYHFEGQNSPFLSLSARSIESQSINTFSRSFLSCNPQVKHYINDR